MIIDAIMAQIKKDESSIYLSLWSHPVLLSLLQEPNRSKQSKQFSFAKHFATDKTFCNRQNILQQTKHFATDKTFCNGI
jgi:hypothetical protein